MADSVAGIVLAAGAGTRLRPLSLERPKALCPVAGEPLIDRALRSLSGCGLDQEPAVNLHHGADVVREHLGEHHPAVHQSVESELLGTAGALGALRAWIDHRPVVLVNVDAVHDVDLGPWLHTWDRERIRLVGAGPAAGLDRSLRLCATFMPWEAVSDLVAEPSSVFELVWRPWHQTRRTDIVAAEASAFFDSGTPAGYLAANLWCSGGKDVIGAGALVEGELSAAVVWDGAEVHRNERLARGIRTTKGRTVLVR
jgi:hypothetical protein